MKNFWSPLFLAGFILANAILCLCPGTGSGGDVRPNVVIALRNTGGRTILESSVKLGKDVLACKTLPGDSARSFNYDKPLPATAKIRLHIENEPVMEQVASLQGWNENIPAGTANIRIYFDVRTDINKILISFMYLDAQNRMLDFRKGVYEGVDQ